MDVDGGMAALTIGLFAWLIALDWGVHRGCTLSHFLTWRV